MPTKIWQPGDDLNATDINSYLQNQMVRSFPNAAARNQAIPVPTVGMVTYLANTAAVEVYTDKTTPPSWRPPWNTAWGMVWNFLVPDITINGSAQQLLVRDVPMKVPNRLYRGEVDGHFTVNSTASQAVFLQWVVNGGAQETMYLNNNVGWNYRFILPVHVPGATTNVVNVICWTDGSYVGGNSWGRCRVFDVGGV